MHSVREIKPSILVLGGAGVGIFFCSKGNYVTLGFLVWKELVSCSRNSSFVSATLTSIRHSFDIIMSWFNLVHDPLFFSIFIIQHLSRNFLLYDFLTNILLPSYISKWSELSPCHCEHVTWRVLDGRKYSSVHYLSRHLVEENDGIHALTVSPPGKGAHSLLNGAEVCPRRCGLKTFQPVIEPRCWGQ